MAEYIQTVGFALDAARELLTAARSVTEARHVLRKIVDRADLIEASLRSIQDILSDMDERLRPMISPDRYQRLQGPLVMCVNSCERELNESFSLLDSRGARVTTPTIMQRLKVAAKNQKIQEDRVTLDSIISSLNMSISTVNAALHLIQLDPRENSGARRQSQTAFRVTLDLLYEKTQRYNEQVQSRQTELERDAQSEAEATINYPLTPIDSLHPLGDPHETPGAHLSNSDADVATVTVGSESKNESHMNTPHSGRSLNVVADHTESASKLQNVKRSLERQAKDNEWSILHQALYSHDIDTIELLLRDTQGLTNAVDSKGQTPLHHCAKGGAISNRLGKATALLHNGAEVNSEDHSEPKRTPLYLAVQATCTPEQEELVELLVQLGANTDTTHLPDRWVNYACLKRDKLLVEAERRRVEFRSLRRPEGEQRRRLLEEEAHLKKEDQLLRKEQHHHHKLPEHDAPLHNGKDAEVVTAQAKDCLQQLASSQGVRNLRYLIHDKYRLDVWIWSRRHAHEADQDIIELECKRSDAILQQIHLTVNEWEENRFSREEWKIAKRIKDSLLRPDQRAFWGDNQQWDSRRSYAADTSWGAQLVDQEISKVTELMKDMGEASSQNDSQTAMNGVSEFLDGRTPSTANKDDEHSEVKGSYHHQVSNAIQVELDQILTLVNAGFTIWGLGERVNSKKVVKVEPVLSPSSDGRNTGNKALQGGPHASSIVGGSVGRSNAKASPTTLLSTRPPTSKMIGGDMTSTSPVLADLELERPLTPLQAENYPSGSFSSLEDPAKNPVSSNLAEQGHTDLKVDGTIDSVGAEQTDECRIEVRQLQSGGIVASEGNIHISQDTRDKPTAEENEGLDTAESSVTPLQRTQRPPEGPLFIWPSTNWLDHAILDDTITLLQRTIRLITYSLRPRVRPGYQRLQWTCSCGRQIYGDYTGQSVLSLAAKFRSESTEDSNRKLAASASVRSRVGNDEQPPSAQGAPLSPSTSHTRSSSGSSSIPSGHLSGPSPELLKTISATSITQPSTETKPVQCFLGLCNNRSKHLISLGDIPLVDANGKRCIRNDFELFGKFSYILGRAMHFR